VAAETLLCISALLGCCREVVGAELAVLIVAATDMIFALFFQEKIKEKTKK